MVVPSVLFPSLLSYNFVLFCCHSHFPCSLCSSCVIFCSRLLIIWDSLIRPLSCAFLFTLCLLWIFSVCSLSFIILSLSLLQLTHVRNARVHTHVRLLCSDLIHVILNSTLVDVTKYCTQIASSPHTHTHTHI
jgi:hypothetical protein